MVFFLAVITITAAFDGGSVGKVEQVAPAHLRCAVKGQSDQNNRNRQANWYYFLLEGLPREQVRIDLVDLVGEYNFRPGALSVTRNSRPVYSYDGERWTHFTDAQVEWDSAEPRLTLRFTPERAAMWIAHVPPYTNRHLTRLLDDFSRSPHLRRKVIGRGVNGREIPLLTVTDSSVPPAKKKTIWLMARQHAWEAGTSWIAEGALRFLLSDSPESEKLRRTVIWKILPMMDPDGVASGAVRFNENGYDVNRNWDAVDERLMPEIAAARRAIFSWLDSGRRIDLFLALHNTESSDFIEGPLAQGGEPVRALASRFAEALARTASFHAPGPPRDAGLSTTPGMKGRMTVNQALFHERGIPAFLMETMVDRNPKLGRPRTTEDNLRFGAELVRAMAASLAPAR
jgi:murein tripeptide amidase MpaA